MEFTFILIAHWIGDYLLQTTSMATEKSYRLKWLSLHILTYSSVLFAFCLFLFSFEVALAYTLVNGFLHAGIDFITSRQSRKYQDRPRIFYPILGFDQMLHMLSLYLTFHFRDVIF